MRAVQFTQWQTSPELVEVERPRPGPGEVLLKVAGATVEWSFFSTPYESTITNTYWGTLAELHEVVDMYRAGQISPEVERDAMEDALEAYRRLESGQLSGRAVVVPHG